MSSVLLYNELVDAVHEGDGLHILQWRWSTLLIFKATARQRWQKFSPTCYNEGLKRHVDEIMVRYCANEKLHVADVLPLMISTQPAADVMLWN